MGNKISTSVDHQPPPVLEGEVDESSTLESDTYQPPPTLGGSAAYRPPTFERKTEVENTSGRERERERKGEEKGELDANLRLRKIYTQNAECMERAAKLFFGYPRTRKHLQL